MCTKLLAPFHETPLPPKPLCSLKTLLSSTTTTTSPMASPAAARIATPSPLPISPATTSAALDALLDWLHSQQKYRKAQLLEHDEPIQLLLSLRRIPSSGRINPYLLPLPHPLHTSPSICILLPDGSSLPSDPLPFSSVETIPLSSLRSDYIPYEARRNLCGSFDLFFADRRILPLLPRLLGKVFFKKKKHPLRFDVSRKGCFDQIRKGCNSARMHLGTGTCVHIDVGRVSMTKDEILENVAAVLDAAVSKIPKGWGNVRGAYLKLEESVALPIYQVLPEIGMKVKVPTKGDDNTTKKKKGKSLDDNDDGDGKKRKKEKKKKKFGELRYMDAEIDRGNSAGESEEENYSGKKRRKIGGEKQEEDSEIAEDGGGDGSGGDLCEGETERWQKIGRKKKGAKKATKDGRFDGADVKSVDVEDNGGDCAVKSTVKKGKKKVKRKVKGEGAAEEVGNALMVVGDDIDVEHAFKDGADVGDVGEDGEESAVKNMNKKERKEKKEKKEKKGKKMKKGKKEEAAEESEDVLKVGIDGTGKTKRRVDSVRSKDLKKNKRKAND